MQEQRCDDGEAPYTLGAVASKRRGASSCAASQPTRLTGTWIVRRGEAGRGQQGGVAAARQGRWSIARPSRGPAGRSPPAPTYPAAVRAAGLATAGCAGDVLLV